MKKIMIFLSVCVLFGAAAYAQAEKTVSRHMFTTAIMDREPVDTLTVYTPMGDASIYYFSELMNMQGTTVKHVWSKGGAVLHEMKNNVNSARWRTYSSMKAAHFKPGDVVQVEVVGDGGVVFATDTLTIQ